MYLSPTIKDEGVYALNVIRARAVGYRYNHATFDDLVLSGVVGLLPSADRTLTVNPRAILQLTPCHSLVPRLCLISGTDALLGLGSHKVSVLCEEHESHD